MQHRTVFSVLLLACGLIAQEHETSRAGLRSKSVRERVEAVRAIGAAGLEDAQGDLVALLRDPSLDVRLAAVTALRLLGAVDASEHLRGFLRSADPQLRIAAALALLSFDDNESMQDVCHLAERDEVWVRESVIWFLTPAAFDAAGGLFERLLGDPRPDFRLQALAGLQRLDAKRAAPSIVMLLEDPDEVVRQQAAVTLAALDPDTHLGRARGVLRASDTLGVGTPADAALEVLAAHRDAVAWHALRLTHGAAAPPAHLALANWWSSPDLTARLRMLHVRSCELRYASVSEVLERLRGSAGIEIQLADSVPESFFSAKFGPRVESLGARPDAYSILSSLDSRILLETPVASVCWLATEDGVRLVLPEEAAEFWRTFVPFKPKPPGR